MDVFVQGKNRVVLTQSDFRAGGGQGDVYVKGGTAFKVYHDPADAIPLDKMQELSRLDEPDIIRPLDPLLNAQGKMLGYTMRAIPDGIPLIQTFTKAFRQRERLTPERVENLVARLRAGIQHVHDRGILIVDLNEMNFLVDTAGFDHLYFIDVDSYQTRSFPAPVLMESVRDRHCTNGNWNEGTDWFSFAVVSFQMRVGIHPYKGVHPSVKGLEERMKANLSVLNSDVDVPAAALPFTLIPRNYLEWYNGVFERGLRVAPPTGPTDVITVAAAVQVKQQAGSNLFDILEDGEFGQGDIVRVLRDYVLTTEGLYQGVRRLADAPTGNGSGVQLALTPRKAHAILVWLDNGTLRLHDGTMRQDIVSALFAEAFTAFDGRIIFKQGDRLGEVEFVEVGERVLATARHVGNVLPQATQVFDGVVLQSLLGAQWATVFPEPFSSVQVRIREWEGYRIIDARREGRVVMAVGEKQGRYDQFILRFAPDWQTYDVRVLADIAYTGLNFTVLDSGIGVHLNPSEKMELFQATPNTPALRELDDPAVKGDIKLFHRGTQTLFARGNRLYRISLRRS